MAYVEVDRDRRWKAVEGFLTCPEVPEVDTSDAPYFAMDFTDVLEPQEVISSPTITEADSQSITTGDASVDPTGKIVSFEVTAWGAGAVTYTLVVQVTSSLGTTQKISRRGKIRAR